MLALFYIFALDIDIYYKINKGKGSLAGVPKLHLKEKVSNKTKDGGKNDVFLS